jgi:Mlc titration factor MtfA (ptsG expression regulator)
MVYVILAISLLTLLAFIVALVAHHITKRKKRIEPISGSYRQILENDIPFYQKLNPVKKKEFEERVMHFLGTTQITGVRTNVEDIDKIYIAASAIIPIFGFPKWQYSNLNEVLLYPDSFSHEFEQTGKGRHILGMVGHGALNNTMILSQQELRQAFVNKTGKANTAIHEFVHLIDKSDGYVDGIPEILVGAKYPLPWLEYIREEIRKIEENRSDIDPYATTSEAEFFSVASEYFFERPDLLKNKHPELYKKLAKIFNQEVK